MVARRAESQCWSGLRPCSVFFEICIDCPVGEDHFRELSFLHDLALLNPDLLQFCTYYALVAQW